MAADCALKPALERADAADAAYPLARVAETRLRLPLATAGDVRRELARLYREGKAGRRDMADVSRLGNAEMICTMDTQKPLLYLTELRAALDAGALSDAISDLSQRARLRERHRALSARWLELARGVRIGDCAALYGWIRPRTVLVESVELTGTLRQDADELERAATRPGAAPDSIWAAWGALCDVWLMVEGCGLIADGQHADRVSCQRHLMLASYEVRRVEPVSRLLRAQQERRT